MSTSDSIALFAAAGTWLAAIATIAAVIAAIYNARIAMNIATRKKKHEVQVICESGLLQENGESGGNYVRTQSNSQTYINIMQHYKQNPILEIRINNIGELPIRIEGIFISISEWIIHLNALETTAKAELIFNTIDVGMTDVQYYEFEKIVQGERKEALYQAVRSNVEMTLCVQTNFQKLFYAFLPKDFIKYIREVGSAATNTPADA